MIKDFRITGTRVKYKKAGFDLIANPAFKQHIVRNDHGRLARGFEHGADVLNKIELLVRGGGPKILAVVSQLFLFLFPLAIGNRNAAFLPNGGLVRT